ASSSQMRDTMYGCEIVCPSPIGSAASSYARLSSSGGTKSSRGTRSIAASTRSSAMPRARSWRSTIARRSATIGGDAHAEEIADGRRDIRDAANVGIHSDREQRHGRVAGDERAVAAAARMVAAAEIGELPAFRGRDEQLARVRVRERGPRTGECIGLIEDRPVAGGRPAVAVGPEAELLARPPRDRVDSLASERHLDRGLAVEALGEGAGIDERRATEIELAGAVRGGDDDVVLEPGEGRLQLRRPLDRRLPVVGKEDDRIALEEGVPAAGRVEEALNGGIGARQRNVLRALRAVHVRRVVEVGEVVREEVESVTRHEPAADSGRIRVRRTAGATANRERRAG